MCVKDVEVVFELPDASWSTKAEFSPSDIHRQVGRLVVVLVCRSVNRYTGRLVSRSLYWSVSRSVGRCTGRLVGQSLY